MSNLLGLLNEQSSDNRVFKKTELKSIDFDDIFFNSDNRFPMSELMEFSPREIVALEKLDEFAILSKPMREAEFLEAVGKISGIVKYIRAER